MTDYKIVPEASESYEGMMLDYSDEKYKELPVHISFTTNVGQPYQNNDKNLFTLNTLRHKVESNVHTNAIGSGNTTLLPFGESKKFSPLRQEEIEQLI